MKKLLFIIPLLSFALLFSCEQEDDDNIDSNSIVGDWRLEQVTINEVDGEELNDWVSNSTALHLDNDKSYYRNYVAGEWTLSNRLLVLDPGETFPSYYWEYEVLSVSEERLKLRISLTEGEYCCDFEEFNEDEVLTITETYVRSE